MNEHTRRAAPLAAALILTTVTPFAAAQDSGPMLQRGEWYFSPMASYVVDDEDRAANGGYGGQIGVGRVLTDHIAIEVNGFGASLDGFNDVGQTGLGVDLIGLADLGGNVTPYVLFGVGYLQSQYNEGRPQPGFREDTGNASLSIGGGSLFRLGSFPGRLRAEARLRNDLADEGNLTDVVLSAGMLFPFGGAAVAAAPIDADNDGVADSRDRCPNTRLGAIVDAEGCELDSDGDGVADSFDYCPGTERGVRVDDGGCALDSDEDGVADYRDDCPSTPRGTLVGDDGCPLDSDRDGVMDANDDCPNTPRGVRVDFRGCEIRDEIQLPGVTFETASDTLTRDSLSVLDGAVGTLERYTDIDVECSGHTDSRGAAAFNQNLSQQRAESVCDYLRAQGIAASRLRARGYGESQPIADNGTAEGRMMNRRVTLRVID
jgi:OOP family OmpA-OmpF porin